MPTSTHHERVFVARDWKGRRREARFEGRRGIGNPLSPHVSSPQRGRITVDCHLFRATIFDRAFADKLRNIAPPSPNPDLNVVDLKRRDGKPSQLPFRPPLFPISILTSQGSSPPPPKKRRKSAKQSLFVLDERRGSEAACYIPCMDMANGMMDQDQNDLLHSTTQQTR